MNDLEIIIALGTCATFVCIFLVKKKAIKIYLAFQMLMLIIGLVIIMLP